MGESTNLNNWLYIAGFLSTNPLKLMVFSTPEKLHQKERILFQPSLDGGFKYCVFSPPIWGRFPFWLIFFSLGWNHQLGKDPLPTPSSPSQIPNHMQGLQQFFPMDPCIKKKNPPNVGCQDLFSRWRFGAKSRYPVELIPPEVDNLFSFCVFFTDSTSGVVPLQFYGMAKKNTCSFFGTNLVLVPHFLLCLAGTSQNRPFHVLPVLLGPWGNCCYQASGQPRDTASLM